MAEETNELEGVSLMDLAGLDTTGMEAKKRGEVLPRFLGDFECEEAKLGQVEENGKVKMFTANFKWKVIGVHALIDKDLKEEELIGRHHFDNSTIKNQDGIKYLLGYLEELGVKQRGPLGTLVEAAKGIRVKAVITHQKDKNDADRIYSRLGKIKPLAA